MSTAIPSTYTQEFALPDGFPQVLKDLTREILREQPDDIDVFCMNYFEELAKLHSQSQVRSSIFDPTIDPAQQISEMNPSEIEDMIHKLFKEQDTDGNHTLDRHEFKMVFNNLGEMLGLKKNDVRRILAEADCDGNGQISYAEFIPVAVSIVETIVAKWKLRQNEEMQAKVMQDAESHIYHGMPEQELNEILTEIFKEADADGNGTLDLDEFEKCLSDIRLGMTRKEINVLMFETYADKDGKIDYQHFKPLCMKLLVELTAQEWMAPSEDEKALEETILRAFKTHDKEKTGKLAEHDIQQILYKLDLGLTLLQICSIMSESEQDANGFVDYPKFAPRCAFMAHACQHYRTKMDEKKERMQNLHSSDGWGMVYGMDRDTLESKLLEAFHEVDVERVGHLNREEIKVCLRKVLDIDKKTMNALLSLAKKTETALLDYKPVVDEAFRTLKGILELAIIYE